MINTYDVVKSNFLSRSLVGMLDFTLWWQHIWVEYYQEYYMAFWLTFFFLTMFMALFIHVCAVNTASDNEKLKDYKMVPSMHFYKKRKSVNRGPKVKTLQRTKSNTLQRKKNIP